MLKRFMAVVAAAALVAGLTAGCNQSTPQSSPDAPAGTTAEPAASGDQVTITFWKAPHTQNEADLWAPVLAEFEAANPDIKIEHLVTPWDTWTEKYTAAFAGGVPPDVSYMTEGFPQFADAGQLTDLRGYVPDNLADEMAGYDTAFYKGEQLIGVSFLTLASVLYYNTDLFAEAGLEPPKDWAELRSHAKQLTQGDVWGFTAGIYQEYPHIVGQYIIQGGGNLLNEEMTELDFATPEQQSGIQLLYDMVTVDGSIPGIDDFTSDEYGNLFANGKSAMVIGQSQEGQSFQDKNPDLNFAITTVPVGPASDPRKANANYGGVGFLSIAEQSKYKEQSYRFIDYCTLQGGAASYLKGCNFFSGFESINQELYSGDPYMEIAQAAAANMFVYPSHPSFLGEISSEIYLMTENIFRGNMEISAAYDQCNEAIKNILA